MAPINTKCEVQSTPDRPDRVLPPAFYDQRVVVAARACIGKILVRRTEEGTTAGRIVEAEAYHGPEDLAAHSSGGKPTKRTEAMFGPPGHVYMFLLYGMHWAFNIVVGQIGIPHAILIRAIEPTEGLDLMAERRKMDASRRELTNGPGKLCAALALTGADYGVSLTSEALHLERGRVRGSIGRSPRINVDYAGAWASRPWRFYERGNRYVSVKPRE
jgi:DNA-3-methyladenine glycosylase